jgi:hypothetical protein
LEFSKKWHWLTSTASIRKGAKIQYDILGFYLKIFSSKHKKITLKLNAWMNLKSSIVIFQALKPLQPQWPQHCQLPQWPQQPHSVKKFTDPDELIIPSTQMTNTSPFLWNRSSKFLFFNDIRYSFCRRLLTVLRPANVFFFEHWLMKHKCPNLLNPLCIIIRLNYWPCRYISIIANVHSSAVIISFTSILPSFLARRLIISKKMADTKTFVCCHCEKPVKSRDGLERHQIAVPDHYQMCLFLKY